jgi:mono/diheme cytochrome c family protein
MWHIWLTFTAGTLNSVVWIIQGLDGAPRRFATLPGEYDAWTDASIPLVAILALAQLLFVWNIVQTLRGRTSIGTQRLTLGIAKPKLTSPALQGFVMVTTLLALGGLTAAGWAIGNADTNEAEAAFVPAPAQLPGGPSGQQAEGQQVFVAECGSCHALAAANATGTVGPNLDDLQPDQALVAETVRNGGVAMPAFEDRLTPEQIDAVAAYVAESAGASP